jgi:peptide chain release factor 2
LSTAGVGRYFTSVREQATELRIALDNYKKQENIVVLQERQIELNSILEKEDTWNNTHLATQLSQELAATTSLIEYVNDIDEQLVSTVEISDMAVEENDDELIEECTSILDVIEEGLKARRLKALMSSEQDQSDCYLEIVSGAGGADAFHWTKMLANMYSKWAIKTGYLVTYIDEQHDDSAGGVGGFGGGYRRVTLRVEGDCAYGWLQAEAGVHRLVRKSPFDPSGKRHTSFAQVGPA